MKYDCGMTRKEKFDYRTKKYCNWHNHFAWWPVKLGPHDCRWLETVERKYLYVDEYTLRLRCVEYRAFRELDN